MASGFKKLLKNIEKEIENRDISEEEIAGFLSSVPEITNRFIVGGYSSVAVRDKEGHRITLDALREGVNRFMRSPFYRPIQIFHCLVPGALIRKQGEEYVPIENISPGEKVYSHTGKLREVLKTISHDVNGLILKLTLNNGEIIQITDKHEVLTKRGWVKAGKLTTQDILMKTGMKCRNSFHDKSKGKTLIEIYGQKKGTEVCNKISCKRKGYDLTSRHNSNNRRGNSWTEIYGHEKPYYGGSSGERNSQYGNIGRITGEKNPRWKGGISYLDYGLDWTDELKERIRNRDRICQFPGCNKAESFPGKKLIVHHMTVENSLAKYTPILKSIIDDKFVVLVQNGTKINKIEKIWYTGKVYNLEVDEDHSYSGKGIVYHNSDVCIGRILPAWTNPETGETIRSGVDDKGWYTVGEIRGDIDIAQKVREEIEGGNIRSFSIAGTAKKKHLSHGSEGVGLDVDELDIYESTACEEPVNPLSRFDILWKMSSKVRLPRWFVLRHKEQEPIIGEKNVAPSPLTGVPYVAKSRVYVHDPREVPKGIMIQRGRKGGIYYESAQQPAKLPEIKTSSKVSKGTQDFINKIKITGRRLGDVIEPTANALESANLPDRHLAAVRSIEINTLKVERKGGTTMAYCDGANNIVLAGKIGDENILHEIGHAFWDKYVYVPNNNDKWIIFNSFEAATKTGKGFVSYYARTDVDEYFAECYAAFAVNPVAFTKLNPTMGKILKGYWK